MTYLLGHINLQDTKMVQLQTHVRTSPSTVASLKVRPFYTANPSLLEISLAEGGKYSRLLVATQRRSRVFFFKEIPDCKRNS